MKKYPTSLKPKVHFDIDRIYDRKTEIHGPFGGSAQSGIAPSNISDAIFIFTGPSGAQYGYADVEVLDSKGGTTFLYTGEGQKGDMQLTRGNKAILEHSRNGRALHLFRTVGKGKGQQYLGEFVYAGHEFVDAEDIEKNMRKAIVFSLVPVFTAEILEAAEASEPIYLPKTLSEARQLAITAALGGGSQPGQSAIRALYARSSAVKNYVLMRARGICESCQKPAPFYRSNGTPYLEPHHTTRLSDGGADHPQFVGAICPSCHREIHYGQNGEKKNAALQDFLWSIEPK